MLKLHYSLMVLILIGNNKYINEYPAPLELWLFVYVSLKSKDALFRNHCEFFILSEWLQEKVEKKDSGCVIVNFPAYDIILKLLRNVNTDLD